MHKRIATIVALILGSAAPAFASPVITEGFTGVFIWAFLGYCAIIVVAQTVAAIISLLKLPGSSARTPKAENQEA